MMAWLGRVVSRYAWLIVIGWVLIAISFRATAPRWSDVAEDGDFAYLPADVPSAVGQRVRAAAFPHDRSNSQFVVVLARQKQRLARSDLFISFDLLRRCNNIYGAVCLRRVRQLTVDAKAAATDEQRQALQEELDRVLKQADEALNEAVRLDELIYREWDNQAHLPVGVEGYRPRRLAEAHFNRALLRDIQQRPSEAGTDRQEAGELNDQIDLTGSDPLPAGIAELPVVDLWTWRNDLFGKKLISQDEQARLIILQLSNEFMATENRHVVAWLEEYLGQAHAHQRDQQDPGMVIGFSGSAAVGGDLMRCAAESVQQTEWFAVFMVLVILLIVYRSPLLVIVPLFTIGIAVVTSTSLITWLTQASLPEQLQFLRPRVFTTTRVFIVVILFGAGTDYCLFLISRFKEVLRDDPKSSDAVEHSLAGVGQALIASAATTIVGLSMMVWADFGKFRYSGPVIAICLSVTLLACLTLAPAILGVMGRWVFWPRQAQSEPSRIGRRFWSNVGDVTVRKPAAILILVVLGLWSLAVHGWLVEDKVTYDFLNELSPNRPSRQGADLLRQHFPVGETGPLTVLLQRNQGELDSQDGRLAIRRLASSLQIDGVNAIRSSQNPLGEAAGDRRRFGITGNAQKLLLLRHHWRTKAVFLAQSDPWKGRVARMEVVLDDDPFSLEAMSTVAKIERRLKAITTDENSFWHNSSYSFAGTTAAIRDLRAVTQADQRRIQWTVVVAVFAVLLLILRRPITCCYMMVTVLVTYLVTLGITHIVFAQLYGDTFYGLDWKVPLFLFVILVAIGQDYNVYLATRVFEEQSQRGPFAGLQTAVEKTGGIISSCGVIMAGTFIALTSGSWGLLLPASLSPADGLRGMLELGFALAVGVSLDTFLVRPILLPAYFAIVARWQMRGGAPRTSMR